jgi:hypothetical protein
MQRLLAEASVLAGGVHQCDVLGHVWITNGGRQCPYANDMSEPNCSQSVYVCSSCDAQDYGDAGGPGHRDCVIEGPCSHACAEARELQCSGLGEQS